MGKRLENKIALITGGAAGFGKGTAAVLKRKAPKSIYQISTKKAAKKLRLN